MSELIDRKAFIEQERRLYCEDCDRRKGKKNGKLTVCYEIGEAPCRACWLDDALGDLEDFPTASPWHRVEDELPDLLQFVVVCNDEGKCVVAQYVGYQTGSMTPWRIAYTMYDTDIYDEKECGPVRYWMPIEPPEWIKDVDDPPEFDPCYECGGYGDDYHIDEDGELVSNCPDCPFNKNEGET